MPKYVDKSIKSGAITFDKQSSGNSLFTTDTVLYLAGRLESDKQISLCPQRYAEGFMCKPQQSWRVFDKC